MFQVLFYCVTDRPVVGIRVRHLLTPLATHEAIQGAM